MLAEISLNVIDIARNSVRAEASLIGILISRDSGRRELTLSVTDDGRGMDREELLSAVDPFYTSRKTRRIGLGLPFLKQAAEITGGTFDIKSSPGEGTCVTAVFHEDHIDCMPLGDISGSIETLVTSTAEKVDFVYTYERDGRHFTLDTRELRAALGDVPFSHPEAAAWIRAYLEENKQAVDTEII